MIDIVGVEIVPHIMVSLRLIIVFCLVGISLSLIENYAGYNYRVECSSLDNVMIGFHVNGTITTNIRSSSPLLRYVKVVEETLETYLKLTTDGKCTLTITSRY